jgi:hypothetical protein
MFTYVFTGIYYTFYKTDGEGYLASKALPAVSGVYAMADEEPGDEGEGVIEKTIHCPHCTALLTREDITVIMFPRATVLACPRCKKSLSLSSADF